MKIRLDFVTNSSSSCFIIKPWRGEISVVEVTNVMQALLEAHNKIENTDIKLEDICIITDSKDRVYINKLFDEECWDGENCIDCHVEDSLSWNERCKLTFDNCPHKIDKCTTYTEKVLDAQVAIFGFENEIPYNMHGAIIDYLSAKKFHLG